LRINILLLIGGAIALLTGLLVVTGISPGEAGKQFIMSSLGSAKALSGTLVYTTPLLIAGIAVYLGIRAGLFNVGVEGQLLVGALIATAFALKMPNIWGLLLGILGGMVGGALWALPAGLIKAYKGGHEVITTIMLNNIALYLTSALVVGSLKDPNQEGPTTPFISELTRLPALYSNETLHFTINIALVIGGILLVVYAFWLRRTVAGYEMDVMGANPIAALFAGICVTQNTVRAMLMSGAIAGLAGAFQVLAYQGRFFQGFSPGYGYDAIGVALLAGSSPWGILPSAFLFGTLNKGTAAIQLFGVPKGFSGVVLGLLIICFAAYRYRKVQSDV
jgi:simple sugar transport system permease protein